VAAACGDTSGSGPAADTGAGEDDGGEDLGTGPVRELEPVDVALAPVANLQFPTAMASRPGSDLLYVTEQAGRVRVLRPGPDGVASLDPAPVLDISTEVGPDEPGGEPGLLGITFSPDGSRLYLSYTHTLAPERGWQRRITEWQLQGDTVVPESRRAILDFRKNNPQHNGGDIRFGPDGFLYAGFGDTAPVGDAFETGQDPTDLLGGVIRIDPLNPDPGLPYGIPDDNPWADGEHEGEAGAPEVWLYGTRNPWRLSFDRATGDLWIADVGDQQREEINHLPAEGAPAAGPGAGANLGWSQLEGTEPFQGREAPEGDTLPIYDYSHEEGGCSVIGGYVYRGTAIPELEGTYLFSDYCRPEVRGLRVMGDEVLAGNLGPELEDELVLAFGEDADGEVYVLTSTAVFALLPGQASQEAEVSELGATTPTHEAGQPAATTTVPPSPAPPTIDVPG